MELPNATYVHELHLIYAGDGEPDGQYENVTRKAD